MSSREQYKAALKKATLGNKALKEVISNLESIDKLRREEITERKQEIKLLQQALDKTKRWYQIFIKYPM
jgi:hypothetical protein